MLALAVNIAHAVVVVLASSSSVDHLKCYNFNGYQYCFYRGNHWL